MRYVLLPTVWNQHYVFAIFSLWCIRMNHELNKSADPCTFGILTFHVWQMNMMVWRIEDLGIRSPKKKRVYSASCDCINELFSENFPDPLNRSDWTDFLYKSDIAAFLLNFSHKSLFFIQGLIIWYLLCNILTTFMLLLLYFWMIFKLQYNHHSLQCKLHDLESS